MKPIATPFALDRFVPYRLSVLSNTVSDAIARLYRSRFGLTIAEWRCMAVLGSFAPLSANDVAARTAMDKVQVSRAVAALLQKGFALQATDRQDRRRSKLALSASGSRVYARIVPLAQAAEAELLAALSPSERKRLSALLDKLTAHAASLAQQRKSDEE
jgi:DNA-binding MarR family transcriptional regulator